MLRFEIPSSWLYERYHPNGLEFKGLLVASVKVKLYLDGLLWTCDNLEIYYKTN